MHSTMKDPEIHIATAQSNLLNLLKEANKSMEIIWHSLESYLDAKRQLFPRFFFLSNEEIFEIMSKIHDPSSIKPYLPKCFDKVDKLVFNSQQDQVLAMMNTNGEKLTFIKSVVIEGPVENWLVRYVVVN